MHVFGRQLKRFRECTEYDRAAFGSATGYSASTIASYEQGRRVPPPRFIEQADELPGASLFTTPSSASRQSVRNRNR